MEEAKDLKMGDTATYEVAGQTVTLKPATLGRMKVMMAALTEGEMDTFDRMRMALHAVLDNGQNPFATHDWIENNVTLPQATRMLDDMRAINGLKGNDFFGKPAAPAPRAEQRDLEEAPTP